MKLRELANKITEIGEILFSTAFAIAGGVFFGTVLALVIMFLSWVGRDTLQNIF